MIIIARRLLRHGLTHEQVASWLSITPEELDKQLQDAEDRRVVLTPAGRMLMTPLLARPEMDHWETKKAER